MADHLNGHEEGGPRPSPKRRSRLDAAGWSRAGQTSPPEDLAPGYSGRRFVIAACLVVLAIWGTLYLAFRQWRAGYRIRAEYGVTRVAPIVSGFLDVTPPDVDRSAWQSAVAETYRLLVTVVASNLLDMPRMEDLRRELEQAVARARAEPSSATAELASIWDKVADRASFVFRDGRSATGERHPRPAVLPPPPKPKSRAAPLESQPGGLEHTPKARSAAG